MSRHSNNGFTFFVLISPKRAAYSFDGYTTKDGETVGIEIGKKETGKPLYKRFVFSRGNRMLRIPNRDTETIEFLRNHPECQDSENNPVNPDTGKTEYATVFKELNEERDADIALEAAQERNKAENAAFALKGEQLRNVAILCGCDSMIPKIQLTAVTSYAASNPKGFLEFIEDDVTTDLKAEVKQAEKAGVIKKRGFVFKFGDVVLGNSQDAVIERLKEDAELRKAIKERAKNS